MILIVIESDNISRKQCVHACGKTILILTDYAAWERMSENGGNGNQASFKRRMEAERIEASLIRSIHIPGERIRIEERVIRHAAEDPSEMVTILLHNYRHDNKHIATEVRKLLDRLAEERMGMKAVLDDINHPVREIREAAVEYLRERNGIYATSYAAFLQHADLLIALARSKDIPVADIQALVEVSKESFLDGEMIDAMKDIASSIDFIKHRHRAADQLKGYVTEILRMAPDLTRLGVYDERFEEPLKRAINASKMRALDETKEIIAIRGIESSIRNSLDKIAKVVRTRAKLKPTMQMEQMQGDDVMALVKLRNILGSVTQLTVAGKRSESLLNLQEYLKNDYLQYYLRAKKRFDSDEQSASSTVYIIGLVVLKLASAMMPQTAEDIYQKYYRFYETEPSVHIVPWPEALIKLMA